MIDALFHFLIYNPYGNWFLFAGWLIYKFQHFIFRKEIEKDSGEIVGKASSIEGAKYKAKKYIVENHPEGTDKEEVQWELGGKLVDWSIIIVTGVVRLIFVPVKEDGDEE